MHRNPYIFKSRKDAWDLGYKDGYENPEELTSGLTWDDDKALNVAYDFGVNAGQRDRAEELGIVAECDRKD